MTQNPNADRYRPHRQGQPVDHPNQPGYQNPASTFQHGQQQPVPGNHAPGNYAPPSAGGQHRPQHPGPQPVPGQPPQQPGQWASGGAAAQRGPVQHDGYARPVHPGQPTQPRAYPQQAHPGPPVQRTYAQPRFSPTITQEMRVRAHVQQHAGAPALAPWATQAAQRMPRQDPSAGADIARIIVAAVLGGILALGMFLIVLFASISFEGVGALIVALSTIPLAFIILMVLWFDRWKPQPKLLLAVCLLWGAVASVIMTLIASFLGIFALAIVGFDASGDVFGAVIMAPITEEITKGVILVVIVLAARKHFEGPLDGWVYGSLIGAGFAFTENILYLSTAYAEASQLGLWMTFVMRCLLSPLLHSAFVACAGIAIGLAARRGAWWLTVIMWFPGLLVGMFLHGLWNGVATLTSGLDNVILVFGITIALSGLIAVGWFIVGLVLRHNESKHTRQSLGDYANAGWLTHAEVDMLGTWKGRRAGKTWASQFPGAKDQMKKMIRTAANLAAIRTRVLAGVGGNTEREVELYQLEKFTRERSALMATVSRPGSQYGRM